jgi:hypothetical protein
MVKALDIRTESQCVRKYLMHRARGAALAISSTVVMALGMVSIEARAALLNDATLLYDASVYTGLDGNIVQLSNQVGDINQDLSFPLGTSGGAVRMAATGTTTPSLYVEANATSLPTLYGSRFSAGGSESLFYYFEIVGPTAASVSVDVGLSAMGVIGATASTPSNLSFSRAMFNITSTSDLTGLTVFDIATGNLDGTKTAVINQTFSFLSNVPYLVGLSVASSAIADSIDSPTGGFLITTAGASAYIDPEFSLSQDLIDQGYRLAFSGNLDSPIQAIPEPGTWAFLLAGLAGLVGLQGVRRSRPTL